MDLTQEQLLKLEKKVSVLLKKSGKLLFKKWRSSKKVSFKENIEPVTKFDLKIEKELKNRLAKIFPGAGFILEEEKCETSQKFNWVIDPIDQTRNFIGQLPLFYIQVALIFQGVPILGVIYNPVSNQLFSASFGNGVKLNGKSKSLINYNIKILKESVVDIDFGGNYDIDWKTSLANKLAKSALRIRMTGGSFAPYLLTGGIDAFVVLNQKTKAVDSFPRIILAKEAGLLYEKIDFEGYTIFITGNKNIFKEIRDLICRSD